MLHTHTASSERTGGAKSLAHTRLLDGAGEDLQGTPEERDEDKSGIRGERFESVRSECVILKL